jgi:hypothetical protein
MTGARNPEAHAAAAAEATTIEATRIVETTSMFVNHLETQTRWLEVDGTTIQERFGETRKTMGEPSIETQRTIHAQ